MKKTILVHGALVGSIAILVIVAGIALTRGDEMSSTSPVGGYVVMLLAFCLIFPAVKRYRDREQGGVIRFGGALALGLGITAVAGVVYVVGWEIYLLVAGHDFIGQYAEAAIRAKEETGVTGAELEAARAEMEEMTRMYANPVFRVPITFLEIVPVGILVSLIAALVLRRRDALPEVAPTA